MKNKKGKKIVLATCKLKIDEIANILIYIIVVAAIIEAVIIWFFSDT